MLKEIAQLVKLVRDLGWMVLKMAVGPRKVRVRSAAVKVRSNKRSMQLSDRLV